MPPRTQSFDPRQVMQRKTFEIFHYRSPKQGNVALHHHDFYEIYYFMGGRVEYRVDGRIYNLAKGDLLLINPMELHQAFVFPDGTLYERFVLWIDRGFLAQCGGGQDDLTWCFDIANPQHTNLLRLPPSQQEDIERCLSNLAEESYSGAYGAEAYAQGLFLQLMTKLNRFTMLPGADGEKEEYSSLIEQVVQYIGKHYAQELTLEALAKQFYVSKYHLSHEFSRVVGTSVHRYLLLRRLLIAREMLSEGQAPGEVATMCGFGDYTSFYRAFRAQYRVSPRSFMAGGQGN